jgi:cell division protein FtsN
MVESFEMMKSPTSAKKFSVSPFMAGLALGLLFAGALALYITQSPLPFVDRVGTRPATAPGGKGASPAADPNKGLLPKDVGIVETPAEAGIEPAAVSPTGMSYLIQVGAFRAPEDAEQMRARMAILGFEAKVSNVEREGATWHRVRLGPYPSIEDLNRARARVEENGIDSMVVRVGTSEQ